MKTKLLLFLMTAFLFLTQCKKDDNDGDNSNDLTIDIVGRYDNVADDLIIVVNRVDDNTVSISLDQQGGINQTFNDVTLQSKTSFTLNEIRVNDNNTSNPFAYTYSGQGTNSANNISISIKEALDYVNSNDFDSDNTITYIATKVN
jgi:hypothetical protein